MTDEELIGVLEFMRNAEKLKNTLRSARTSSGRPESVAEHTWRLCLMVMLFEKHYGGIDLLKLIKICIVHDLGEAIGGDIPAVDQVADSNKHIIEREDLKTLIAPLSPVLKKEILSLWDEYEAALSEEARLAKAFDKLETLLQHTQGKNSKNFDYGFNLGYGKKQTDTSPLTARLRVLIDNETKRLAVANNTDSP